MNKVELKICMGTMCYVMGGAELRAVVDSLPAEQRHRVHVSYSPCLGTCNNNSEAEPPYVEVNGRLIARVSKSTLLQILKEELHNVV